MKIVKNIIGIASIGVLAMLASCDGGSTPTNNQGTKFQPKKRESSFSSDADRQAAIDQKKKELSLNAQTILYSRDVKLSVIPPKVQGEDISQELAEAIASKMLELTCANGIGGLNNVPGFALTADFAQTGKEATGTAPQKMLTNYTVTYKVMNMTSGDVYGACTQEIIGAGRSFEEANQNAVQNMKNTDQIQSMLKESSEKIIAWYNENLQTFKNQVESAEGKQDYALALAYVESVPEKATAAFQYATEKQPGLFNKFRKKVAAQEMKEMQSAIVASNGEFSAEVMAHFMLIPSDAAEYAQAKALIDKYSESVQAKQKSDADRVQQMEMAKIDAEVKKAKYESDAIKRQNREMDYCRDGFFGALGKRLMSGIDAVSDAISD